MEPPAGWPFDESPNVATLTTRGVIDGTDWIGTVSHDEDDGAWQFIGSRGARIEDGILVALQHLLRLDPTIAELADLPEGWRAWRDDADAAWQRAPKKEA
jgi:hypothetical protein